LYLKNISDIWWSIDEIASDTSNLWPRLETRANPRFQKNQFFWVKIKKNLCSRIILMCWSQKWFFKNEKKYYFDAFLSEKHFEPQPQPHCQTSYGPCHQRDSTIFHCLNLFESVVAVAFQSVFHLEIYQNNIFFIF